MSRPNHTEHDQHRSDGDRDGRRGHRRGRRPSAGEAVGPGFVPGVARDVEEETHEADPIGGRGHRPRRGGPRGGSPFGGTGFGPGGPGSRGPRGGRGRGRPRGDVRAAILLLLAEGPRHGYQLIQDITERSEGAWAPSAGSVYPTLQVLEDEGLIVIEAVDGRKTASLTEVGGSYVTEHRERLGTPWDTGQESRGGEVGLREAMASLFEAGKQVARVGDAAQQQRAIAELSSARTALYRILADDEAAGTR